MMRRHLGTFAALVALGLLASVPMLASCEAERGAPKGQLMLVVSSNLAPTHDFDSLHVRVQEDGAVTPALDLDYSLGGSQGVKLPATLGIVSGSDPNKVVHVIVEGRRGGNVRVHREAVTRVPQNRIAALQLAIDGLCIESNCPPDASGESQTCIVGTCQSAKVPVEDLPDYSEALIFGGGTGKGDGACFDTIGCFSAGKVVAPDKDCSVDKIVGTGINLAVLRPPGTEGVCGSNACLLPLDKDPFAGPVVTGWREAKERVLVPRAVCDRSLPLMLTTVCPTKSAPTCGPWSAVGSGSGITADASVPIGDASLGGNEAGGEGGAPAPNVPASLKFRDEDPARGAVRGKVLLGRAADESRISGYELYWADGPLTPVGPAISTLQKSGQDQEFALTGVVPGGATHLIAYSKDAAGLVKPGSAVGPADNYPRSVNIGANAAEFERPLLDFDPSGTAIFVAGYDNGVGRKNPALIRCNLDDSGCIYKNVLSGPPDVSNQQRLLGLAVDTVNNKVLIGTDSEDDKAAFHLFRCGTDAQTCSQVDLTPPPGNAIRENCPLPMIVDPVGKKLLAARSGGVNSYLYRCDLDGANCSINNITGNIGNGNFPCTKLFYRPTEGKVLAVRAAGVGQPYLFRCSVDGSVCNSDELATKQFTEFAAAIDETNPSNPKLLVTGVATNDHKVTLVRCNLDGTGCATSLLDAGDDNAPYFLSLVVDAEHKKLFLFAYSNNGGQYFRCDLDGTNCTLTVTLPYAISSGGQHPSAGLRAGTLFAVSSSAPPALQLVRLSAY